ncbi:hypothetical protein HPB47_003920, partial [Ixodes persulcatus]
MEDWQRAGHTCPQQTAFVVAYTRRQAGSVTACWTGTLFTTLADKEKSSSDQEHPDFVPTVLAHKAPAKRSSEARYTGATMHHLPYHLMGGIPQRQGVTPGPKYKLEL